LFGVGQLLHRIRDVVVDLEVSFPRGDEPVWHRWPLCQVALQGLEDDAQQGLRQRRHAMTTRTSISTTVRNDLFDQVFAALQNVNPDAIVASSYHSNDLDGTTGLSISLSGDLREAVMKRLAAFPDLECDIEVRDMEL
jgi:hypothetical protein